MDVKTGPAAVARNLHHVFGDGTTQRMRLVVMDSYYTSVPLALHLWSRGFYSIGTVVTRRLGLSKYAIEKKKKRPINIERGTFTFAESTKVADLKMLHWWDNRPVHMLCTGGSIKMDHVVRREKSGEQTEVACQAKLIAPAKHKKIAVITLMKNVPALSRVLGWASNMVDSYPVSGILK
ncbi:Hypothetical protein PHPALM_332 [Phytophthora palmivora]|uniref:PiggyBac transposable element-derived protein domain-containing protein n=1 Tax=Phytophthora palmivora TaxID=4796 RepID=A0A2P4YV69_9STRA|nr:Hypothetical protein PHPALM_332 [Phytophthora palmivora]